MRFIHRGRAPASLSQSLAAGASRQGPSPAQAAASLSKGHPKNGLRLWDSLPLGHVYVTFDTSLRTSGFSSSSFFKEVWTIFASFCTSWSLGTDVTFCNVTCFPQTRVGRVSAFARAGGGGLKHTPPPLPPGPMWVFRTKLTAVWPGYGGRGNSTWLFLLRKIQRLEAWGCEGTSPFSRVSKVLVGLLPLEDSQTKS